MLRKLVSIAVIGALGISSATASAQPKVPVDPAPPSPRLVSLCGISIWCSKEKTSGILLLPEAAIGLIQIPFTARPEGRPSYRDGFGEFKPTVGVSGRYWFLSGWLDGHAQILYGLAPTAIEVDGKTREDYVWGLTAGLGVAQSVVTFDIGYFNRRVRSNSDHVDGGASLLININLTAVGLWTATSTK